MRPFNEVPGLVNIGDTITVESALDKSYGTLVLTLDQAYGTGDAEGDWDLLEVLDVDMGQRIPFTADQIRVLLPILQALVREN